MGQQDRYSTLDAFTRGVVDAAYRAGAAPSAPEHVLRKRRADDGADAVISAIRIDLTAPLPHCGARRLDMFELYWAPLTQRKIKLPRVLAWLARTSLTPLREWATDPQVSPAQDLGGAIRALLYAIGRAVLFVTAIVLIISPFALAVGFRDRLENAGDELGKAVTALDGWAQVDLVATALLAAGALALSCIALRTLVGHRPRIASDLEKLATRRWVTAAFLIGGILAVGAAVLSGGWMGTVSRTISTKWARRW